MVTLPTAGMYNDAWTNRHARRKCNMCMTNLVPYVRLKVFTRGHIYANTAIFKPFSLDFVVNSWNGRHHYI